MVGRKVSITTDIRLLAAMIQFKRKCKKGRPPPPTGAIRAIAERIHGHTFN